MLPNTTVLTRQLPLRRAVSVSERLRSWAGGMSLLSKPAAVIETQLPPLTSWNKSISVATPGPRLPKITVTALFSPTVSVMSSFQRPSIS